MNSTKNIQVKIPSEIQEKIDTGEYRLNGNQVRDKLGRIVCNLKTLDIDDEHFFSPRIFVSLESYAFISVSTVSTRLQNELAKLRASYVSINGKIDRILINQTNSLIASITNFEEHFNSLAEKSTLTDEKITFTAGTQAASQLAAILLNYINDYLGETIVKHREESYSGEKYSAYLARKQQYRPEITQSKFNNFEESEAYYFTYTFINIVNNINILSLCYDYKIYPRYEDNLKQVRAQMIELLSKLIWGLGKEGDIYKMCYSTDKSDRYTPIKNIDKLLQYSGTDIHQLLLRNFEKHIHFDFDLERSSSINTIVRILDDIDNLLQRKEQFSDLKLGELPELEQIKKLTFGK